NELTQLPYKNNMDQLTNQRREIWYVAVKMIKDHPLTGIGRGMFESRSQEYIKRMPQEIRSSGRSSFWQPHNMYLGFMTDAGIPSLIIFMLAFFLSIKKAWQVNRRQSEDYNIPWGLVCFAMFIGQMIQGIGCDVFEVRSDMLPIFAAIWGILIVLPEDETNIKQPH
ncbi:MAG: O-antigen ligase family protein, partial [Synergistaceae bacterium]|nr:O-antigen ligase family protein [Synergistaceae bacterium]